MLSQAVAHFTFVMALEMGASKNLSVWPALNLRRNLALNPPPKPFNVKPSSASPPLRKSLFICRCSLVNEQQQQQAFFTVHEKQLIDALIGIQGRGRAASPQQHNVQQKHKFSFFYLISLLV